MSDNVVNFEELVKSEDFSSTIENEEVISPLISMFEVIMSFDDANLVEPALEIYKGIIKGIFTNDLRAQLIDEIVITLKKENISYETVIAKRNTIINNLQDLIEELKPSKPKHELLSVYVDEIKSIYDAAIEKYNGISIVLPIKLDEGAQIPTYAHEGDAAADLYAAEDTTIPAHSISNMVRTGVHIALPGGWTAFIVPRSSIGMKTGLRLSNSIGVIDQPYRGTLGVIYDNISDSDYTIKQGDRIAQMFILPTYRFKAQVVDELDETERGDGAYGSTGK